MIIHVAYYRRSMTRDEGTGLEQGYMTCATFIDENQERIPWPHCLGKPRAHFTWESQATEHRGTLERVVEATLYPWHLTRL